MIQSNIRRRLLKELKFIENNDPSYQFHLWNFQNILRIDDFPTGIRPLPNNRKAMFNLIESIDNLHVPYILGIVPALCTTEDWRFLHCLRNMVPAMHGVTHKYYEISTLLLVNNDLKNASLAHEQFDEFKGIPLKLLSKIVESHKFLMENSLSKEVKIYIPPCNKIGLLHSRILRKVGFEFIMSEGSYPLFFLPRLKSTFYGRSGDVGCDFAVTTLHATWELDRDEPDSINLTSSFIKKAMYH